MPIDAVEIADNADMMVGGYAFNRQDDSIKVVNVFAPQRVALFADDGRVNETSMDDIELHLVQSCLERNKRFLEKCNA